MAASEEEVHEESDNETIGKVYDKYVETYGRKPRYADHLRNFANKFHDVQLSFGTAKHFLTDVDTSDSLFVTPKTLAMSSISTPNILTSSNRIKQSKLKRGLNTKYEDFHDLQMLKLIQKSILTLKSIKDNPQITKELNAVFGDTEGAYYELNKRLSRSVRFHPSTISRQSSISKDETFLSLKKMSEATDVSDVDHDTSLYLLRNFFGEETADADDESVDDSNSGLKEEALGLYDSMLIKYQKSRRNILIDPSPIRVQQSAPVKGEKLLHKPIAIQPKRLSFTLNEKVKPDFLLSCIGALDDDVFRQLSTTSSFDTITTEMANTEMLDAFSPLEEKEKAETVSIQVSNMFNIMSKYNDAMDRWDFDVFEFMDDPVFAGKGLVYLSFYLFRKTGLLESTGVSQPHFWKFLEFVDMGYLDNPYHNKYHAVDVILNTHFFFQSSFMKTHMSLWDQFGAYIAGLCHDLGHMGFNNNWYVNTAGNLALLYGDESVLENYHVNETFRLLTKTDANWMLSFPSSIRKYLAIVIKDCIIATDVKFHGSKVHQLHQMIEVFNKEKDDKMFDNFNHIQLQKCLSFCNYSSLESIRKDNFKLFMNDEREKEFEKEGDIIINDIDIDIDADDEKEPSSARIKGVGDERLFILGVVIHGCDVANPCKPLKLCKQWADNYITEAFKQGDIERSFGIPVSPGMDRDTTKLANSQIGFITFIVKKLFELMSELIGSSEARQCLDIMLENEKYWIQLKKEQTSYKIAKVPDLGTIVETPVPDT